MTEIAETEDTASTAQDRAATGQQAQVNIRNFSVKCGHCQQYQTLVGFAQAGDWNVYTYECDDPRCDPARSRTLIEIPAELDEFANRDPSWRGGQKHSGGC